MHASSIINASDLFVRPPDHHQTTEKSGRHKRIDKSTWKINVQIFGGRFRFIYTFGLWFLVFYVVLSTRLRASLVFDFLILTSIYLYVCAAFLLFYTVLYKTVQYCTKLYSSVQNCTVLYKTVQNCTELYSTVQYCTVLYSTVQYCTVLYSTV